MKKYDYVLFDWDGNIAETLDLWISAADEVLRKRNVKFTRQQLIESCRGFVKFVVGNSGVATEEAAEALEEVNEIVNKNLPNVELYPGAAQTLIILKSSGKHLALITTSRRHLIEPVLHKYGLIDLFEAVICAEDVEFERRKPHPESLLIALQKMNGSPDKAIMVGDRDKDILAGRNAGMDSALFYSKDHQQFYSLQEQMACKPTYMIEEFADLIKLIG